MATEPERKGSRPAPVNLPSRHAGCIRLMWAAPGRFMRVPVRVERPEPAGSWMHVPGIREKTCLLRTSSSFPLLGFFVQHCWHLLCLMSSDQCVRAGGLAGGLVIMRVMSSCR